MKNEKSPTKSEVAAIGQLIARWPEVVSQETARRFRGDAPDRQEDARAMLVEYLLARGVNYLDRYCPKRDRSAPAAELVAQLDRVLDEPRGAWRMWARSMARWAFRDWLRQRKRRGEALEVYIETGEEEGLSFERLRVQDTDEDPRELSDSADQARDIVAALLAAADPNLQMDMAVFLAAEESGDRSAVMRAHGTNLAAVMARLARLRPAAAQKLQEAGVCLI